MRRCDVAEFGGCDGDAAVPAMVDDVSSLDRLSLIVNGLTSTPAAAAATALARGTLQPPLPPPPAAAPSHHHPTLTLQACSR